MQGRLKDSFTKRKFLRPKKVLQIVKTKEKQGTQLTKKKMSAYEKPKQICTLEQTVYLETNFRISGALIVCWAL